MYYKFFPHMFCNCEVQHEDVEVWVKPKFSWQITSGIQMHTLFLFSSICWNDKWKILQQRKKDHQRGNKGLHDHKVNYLSISCKRRRPGTVRHANHSQTPKRAVVWQVCGHASENFATLTSLIWWENTRRWWKKHLGRFRYVITGVKWGLLLAVIGVS